MVSALPLAKKLLCLCLLPLAFISMPRILIKEIQTTPGLLRDSMLLVEKSYSSQSLLALMHSKSMFLFTRLT